VANSSSLNGSGVKKSSEQEASNPELSFLLLLVQLLTYVTVTKT
jgi:hypothetical protein